MTDTHFSLDAWWMGGYFGVEGRPHPPWLEREAMPKMFWTPSECLVNLWPGSWGLWWVHEEPDTLEAYRVAMGLSVEEFEAMRQELDQWMQDGRFGWPHVFLELDAARAFLARYLRNAPPQLKLLGIALPPHHARTLIEENHPGPSQGPQGVYLKLQQQKSPPAEGRLLGFEVLGFDTGGFHSFVCNGLEDEYAAHLGISLNDYGLLKSAEEAETAASYTMRDDVGAEPCLWQPWAIYEYTLTAYSP